MFYPVGHTKSSRKSIYRIKDHFFLFYYHFITKHFSLLEQEMIDRVYHQLILPHLNAFFGQTFEEAVVKAASENERLTLVEFQDM